MSDYFFRRIPPEEISHRKNRNPTSYRRFLLLIVALLIVVIVSVVVLVTPTAYWSIILRETTTEILDILGFKSLVIPIGALIISIAWVGIREGKENIWKKLRQHFGPLVIDIAAFSCAIVFIFYLFVGLKIPPLEHMLLTARLADATELAELQATAINEQSNTIALLRTQVSDLKLLVPITTPTSDHLTEEQQRDNEIKVSIENLIASLTGPNLSPNWIVWVTDDYEHNLLQMYNNNSNILQDHFRLRDITVDFGDIKLRQPDNLRAYVSVILAETVGEDVFRCNFEFTVDYKEGEGSWLVAGDQYLSQPTSLPIADKNCY